MSIKRKFFARVKPTIIGSKVVAKLVMSYNEYSRERRRADLSCTYLIVHDEMVLVIGCQAHLRVLQLQNKVYYKIYNTLNHREDKVENTL